MAEVLSEGEPIEPGKDPVIVEIGEKALLGVGTLAEVIGVEEARAWFDQRQKTIDFLHERSIRRHGLPDRTARFK